MRYGEPGETYVGAHTDHSKSTVFINAKQLEEWPEMTWITISHELGHVKGLAHHGNQECTMYWEQKEPVFKLECEN